MTSHALKKNSLVIDAVGITKHFKKLIAVDNVSLQINKGQIFGLLGPNAAGKTTVIRMLCGVIEKDAGEIRINNQSVASAKNSFGYVAQHFGQYEELSVWENLKFYARMYGVKDEHHLEGLLDRYGLGPYKYQKAGSLSGGFQRRLALVCALAHDPMVLFLDEPTAGIDPVTRKLLWDDFYDLSAQGKTLFITTHYMEEAQRCHRLAFIDLGRIIASGTPATIKESLGEGKVYTLNLPYQSDLHGALLALDDVMLVNQFGTELRIVAKCDLSVSVLEKLISDFTNTPVSLLPGEPNLEDVFISLTQHRGDAKC